MVRACAVKSCPSGRKSKKVVKETSCSVSFFQAKTPARLQHWTKSLGIALKASDYICQFHFKEKDIKMYSKIVIGNKVHLLHLDRKDLTEDAVPTIEHQLQLNPKLQKQVQQQLDQEQQQSEQEQLQPEQEQLQPKQEQLQPKQEQLQPKQEELQPKQEQLQPKQEQLPPKQEQLQYEQEQEQQQLEQEQQQPEQIPQIVKSISYFRKNLTLLPQHWTYAEKPDAIEFIRIDPVRMQIQNHIALNEDFSISIIFTNFEKLNLNDKLSSPDEIFDYLKSVEKWQLCVGTQIEKRRYSNECKRVVIGDEAYQRNQRNPRCKSCRVLRSRLQSCNSNIKLQKWVARKRRTVNVIKQCKRLKTTEEQCICDICGHTFIGKEALTKHRKQKHDKLNNCKYRCKVCSFSTVNLKEMYSHAQKHANGTESKHLCESCGKCFTSRLTLLRHSLQHKTNSDSINVKLLNEGKHNDFVLQMTMCDKCGQSVDSVALNEHKCS